MTTIDSSSGAESTMDNSPPDQQLFQHKHLRLQNDIYGRTNKHRRGCAGEVIENDGEDNMDEDAEEGDVEVWKMFNDSFRQVQPILNQNRLLIQQVNENHQSKIPDNLAKNVDLIREINGNISKVVSLYSDLSSNFSDIFHHRRGIAAKSSDTNNVSNGKG